MRVKARQGKKACNVTKTSLSKDSAPADIIVHSGIFQTQSNNSKLTHDPNV